MGLRLAFRTNFCALAAGVLLALLGHILGAEKAVAAVQANPMNAVLWGVFLLFVASLLWLYLQSWVMLVRAWSRRAGAENAKLLLILFLFSFAAAYYFYWKRYDIDSTVE